MITRSHAAAAARRRSSRTAIMALAFTALVSAQWVSVAGAGGACDGSCAAGTCTFMGILNTPVGASSLSINGSCQLVVSGVGSTYLDGVIQSGLSSVYMVTTLATPNFSGSLLGTGMRVRQVGTVDGQAGREISFTSMVNVNGSDVLLDMDCGAIGVAAYATEIYDAGGLVYAQAPTTYPPAIRFAKTDALGMACAILPDGDVYTTLSFGEPRGFTIQTLSGTLGPFTGTCLKLRGFSPTNVPTSQSAIENYLKDTGGLVIASLYAGPLPATDWVCATAPVPARPSSWGGLKLRYR